MDISTSTITIGSVAFILGVGSLIFSWLRTNKNDIKHKASDYAILKNNVLQSEKKITSLEDELKEFKRESRKEFQQLEDKLFKKVESIDTKVDELKSLIIEKL